MILPWNYRIAGCVQEHTKRFKRDSFPVAMVDPTQAANIYSSQIPCISDIFAIMIMGPRLCIPEKVIIKFSGCLEAGVGSILIAASAYGVKGLLHLIPRCTMCRSAGWYTIHIPKIGP